MSDRRKLLKAFRKSGIEAMRKDPCIDRILGRAMDIAMEVRCMPKDEFNKKQTRRLSGFLLTIIETGNLYELTRDEYEEMVSIFLVAAFAEDEYFRQPKQ